MLKTHSWFKNAQEDGDDDVDDDDDDGTQSSVFVDVLLKSAHWDTRPMILILH